MAMTWASACQRRTGGHWKPGSVRAGNGAWRGAFGGRRGAGGGGRPCPGAPLQFAARQTRRPGCPEAVFTCGRAEALPFADASFEVVWCTDVLEHLADLPAAIAQM